MKKNEKNDLKTKTLDELRRTLFDLIEKMDKIRVEKVEGKLKNTNAIKNTKHDIARVLTFLSIKSLMEKEQEKGEYSDK